MTTSDQKYLSGPVMPFTPKERKELIERRGLLKEGAGAAKVPDDALIREEMLRLEVTIQMLEGERNELIERGAGYLRRIAANDETYETLETDNKELEEDNKRLLEIVQAYQWLTNWASDRGGRAFRVHPVESMGRTTEWRLILLEDHEQVWASTGVGLPEAVEAVKWRSER